MKKTRLSLIIGIILGLVMLAVWASYINVQEMFLHIRSVKLIYVLYASAVYISAYVLRSVRWNMLLNTRFHVGIKQTFIYSMAGNFLNYMIPIRAGELAKSYFLKKNEKIPYTGSFPSIFVDKVFDTLGVFIVLIMIPFLHLEFSSAMVVLLGLLILVFIFGFLVIGMAAGAHGQVTALLQKFFFWLPASIKQKVYRIISSVVEGTGLFHHHRRLLAPVVLITILGILLDAIYFYYIFLAFDLRMNFFIVMFGYTLINLSYVLPQPPAQLGSNEWLMVIIFAVGFGLNKDQASAIMAFAHILTALIMSAFGVFSLSYAGIRNIDFLSKEDALNDTEGTSGTA